MLRPPRGEAAAAAAGVPVLGGIEDAAAVVSAAAGGGAGSDAVLRGGAVAAQRPHHAPADRSVTARLPAGPAGSGRPARRCPLCSGFASPPGGAAPPPRPPAAARCAPHSRCSAPPVSAGLCQHPAVPRLRRLPEDPPQAAQGWRPARPRPRTATAPPGAAGARLREPGGGG